MKKDIVYLIVSHGEDGRGHEVIRYASLDEIQRNRVWAQILHKGYYSKVERIVDLEEQYKKSVTSLDGLDRLVLDHGQRYINSFGIFTG